MAREVNWRLWPLLSDVAIAAVHTELAGYPTVDTGFSTTYLHNFSHSASLLSVSRLILVRFDSSIPSRALTHLLLSFGA